MSEIHSRQSSPPERECTEDFKFLARELTNTFPELDLRFNYVLGSKEFRCLISEEEDEECFELEMGLQSAQDLLIEATFHIKELAQLFDD